MRSTSVSRPKPVRTTVAPCCWATLATWKAIEESVSTPVMRMRLPSSSPIAGPFLLRSVAHVRLVAHAQAAVHRDDRPRNVGGVRPGDELHDAGHLVGRCRPA